MHAGLYYNTSIFSNKTILKFEPISFNNFNQKNVDSPETWNILQRYTIAIDVLEQGAKMK